MSTQNLQTLTGAPIEVFNPSTGMNVLITDENLPTIIKQQIKGIKDITKKVNCSTRKAQELKDKAFKNKEAGVHVFKKKAAIEDLQQLAKDSTELQDDFAQNQKYLFENQKQLSGALKFVFAISVTSLARTTLAISVIKAELEGASKEKLSEMERQELQGLLDQLQAQESLRKKLEDHDMWFTELAENKQDKIDNLDEIKANATLGKSAVQPETLKLYVKTDDSRLTNARPASDVPAWAKEKVKPSYTAKEVHALPDNTPIPSKVSDLQNDSGYLTEHQPLAAYATTEWVKVQNYLTTHQDISGKANQSFVEQQLECTNDSVKKIQEDLQKAYQEYRKLKMTFITTSICIGTVSIGALITLLITIL